MFKFEEKSNYMPGCLWLKGKAVGLPYIKFVFYYFELICSFELPFHEEIP